MGRHLRQAITDLRGMIGGSGIAVAACSPAMHLGTQATDRVPQKEATCTQEAAATSGSCHLHASIRTEGLTTDQGIRFRKCDPEVPARLNVIFGQFSGTIAWSLDEQDLAIPLQTKLLPVQVIRQPPIKIDSKVRGAALIDDLKLEPTTIPSQ